MVLPGRPARRHAALDGAGPAGPGPEREGRVLQGQHAAASCGAGPCSHQSYLHTRRQTSPLSAALPGAVGDLLGPGRGAVVAGIAQWPAWLRRPCGWCRPPWPWPAMWPCGSSPRIPPWLVPVLLVVWPLFVLALCWAMAQRDGRRALRWHLRPGRRPVPGHRYLPDLLHQQLQGRHGLPGAGQVGGRRGPAVVREVRLRRPLGTFQLLFYGHPRSVVLRNLEFLRNGASRHSVYVLGRANDLTKLKSYGTAEVVLQSKQQRDKLPGRAPPLPLSCAFRHDLKRSSAQVPHLAHAGHQSPRRAVSRLERSPLAVSRSQALTGFHAASFRHSLATRQLLEDQPKAIKSYKAWATMTATRLPLAHQMPPR